MTSARWPDPYTALREIEDLHRKYWVAASPHEYRDYRKAHPEYTGPMPHFVRDNITNIRYLLGVWGIDHVREGHLKDFPPDYSEALLDYIRLFPIDPPHPDETAESKGE